MTRRRYLGTLAALALSFCVAAGLRGEDSGRGARVAEIHTTTKES